MSKIHSTAIIDKSAVIGADVEIGPYCVIGGKVTIGDGCILKSHVAVEGTTIIGEGNVFYPFGYIGSDPQDLKYQQKETILKIGDYNTFRESVSIHRGTEVGGWETVIGDHNLIMGFVHIGHDCHVGNHNIIANYTGLSGHVTLDDYITLGGQNGVTQFVHVGSYVYTGANTIIDKHVAPYITGYGNRIEIKGVNIVGLRRRGHSREVINSILEAHRLFFRSEYKEDEAIRIIEETYGDLKEIKLFIDFIKSAEGGVKK